MRKIVAAVVSSCIFLFTGSVALAWHTLSVSPGDTLTFTTTGVGSCSYYGGFYATPDYMSAINATNTVYIPCNGSISITCGCAGRTVYWKIQFQDSQSFGIQTGTLTIPEATTTTTTVTTTTTTTVATTTTTPTSTATTTPTSTATTTPKSTATTTQSNNYSPVFAELAVRKKAATFNIRINSSFPQTRMLIRASMIGKKSQSWNVLTDQNGRFQLITQKILKGYILSLWVSGSKLDSLKVT